MLLGDPGGVPLPADRADEFRGLGAVRLERPHLALQLRSVEPHRQGQVLRGDHRRATGEEHVESVMDVSELP
jgi:hypothetical protein